jgi:CRP-like cAMP-binding protein
MDDLRILQGMQLFAEFYDAEIKAFVRAAERRAEPAGHVFLRMGTPNASIFIVCQGAVRVERFGAAEDIPIATLGAGQSFGEMSFLDASPATASVTAAEPTEVLVLTRAAVDRMIESYAPLAVKFWRNLALVLKQRLAKTNEVIDQYIDINQVLLQDRTFREYYGRM